MTDQTFADTVLASLSSKAVQPPAHFCKEGQYRRLVAALKSDIIQSKRYVLEDDVTSAAVDLGMQHPDILLAVLKNAFTPFEKIWIEWNPTVQYEAAMSQVGLTDTQMAGEPPMSRHTGVIVTRTGEARFKIIMVGQSMLDTVNDGVYLSSQVGASPLAIEYDLHTPLYGGVPNASEEFIVRNTSWDAERLRFALLGSAYALTSDRESLVEEGEDLAELTEEILNTRLAAQRVMHIRQCDNLAAHARWVFDPIYGEPFRARVIEGPNPIDPQSAQTKCYEHATKTVELQVQEESGVFRFIISAIALMVGRDRIASITPTQRTKRARLVKGKRVPFVETRRVSLTVPRKIANKRIVRALGKMMPRAQHDVEGHWKQKRKNYDFDCEHVMVWETPRREVCAIKDCGFKRWRVDDFKRGDPTIGVINKTRVAKLDRKVAAIPSVANNTYGD